MNQPVKIGYHACIHTAYFAQCILYFFLCNKADIDDNYELVDVLTSRRCVELDHSQVASEYIMQLVFSLINNICDKLSGAGEFLC